MGAGQAGWRRLQLHELRREREITQAALAEALDISQPAVPKIEHADDSRVSTLRDYLHGLGAELQLQAVFIDDETIAIAINRE